jgi:hypothetical protein
VTSRYTAESIVANEVSVQFAAWARFGLLIEQLGG